MLGPKLYSIRITKMKLYQFLFRFVGICWDQCASKYHIDQLLHARFAPHFNTFDISSLEYHPMAMSDKALSFLVVVFCLYLMKRVCQVNGLCELNYLEAGMTTLGMKLLGNNMKQCQGWPCQSYRLDIDVPWSSDHQCATLHEANPELVACPPSSVHTTDEASLSEHSLPKWIAVEP